MLVSYKHGFIFVHIYKVAGTSITSALKSYAKRPLISRLNNRLEQYGVSLNIPYYKYKHFDVHASAIDIRRELPQEVFSDLYKFAFVRNPWDWQVSLYHYILKTPIHHQYDCVKNLQDFEEYIEWRTSKEWANISRDLDLQTQFVMDENGELIVDFIGRYERLEEDFQHVCQVLNVKPSLPHLNKTTRQNYKSYYNERTKRIVEQHFLKDIEMFRYKFDAFDNTTLCFFSE